MAGRIPQTFIDDLLDRIDIVDVIDRRVKLKKSGRNYTACCPFHEEKTPSFSVSPDKQFYYCFGCGAGGNAIGFLMDYERMGFPQAVESLADSAGLEVPREVLSREEPQQQQQKKNLYTILEKAAEYYRQQLKSHPQKQRAIDYLKQRGLSGEIARDFDIGYAPPGWDNLLKALGDNEEDRQLLIDGGMLIDREEDGKLYDRFRDRIMFPIRDNRGRIIAFGGRVLGDDKPKYLNSPETPVFHKGRELYGLYQSRKANRQLQRLLIVEGYMDVVALAQHGINWAAATLGTATSTDHLKIIFRQCPQVVFCFDGDAAGRKAANRALESALPVMEDGRQAKFLFLPEGEDPDSLVRQMGANHLIRLVDKAVPLEDFLFDAAGSELDLASLEGRARLSRQAAPLIDKLPEGIFKELMFDRLAQRTGLSRDKLSEILYQHQQAAEPAPAAESAPPGTETRPEPQRPANPPRRYRGADTGTVTPESTRNPVLFAIALLLHHPGAAREAEIPEALRHSDDHNAPLLIAMLELLQRRPDSSTAMLLGHWHGEPWGEVLRELLQLDQFIPEADLDVELSDTLRHIQRQHQRSKLTNHVDKLLSKDYAQLSEDEKQQLKQSLSELHSK